MVVKHDLLGLLHPDATAQIEQACRQGDVEVFALGDSNRAGKAVSVGRSYTVVGTFLHYQPAVYAYCGARSRALGSFDLVLQGAVGIYSALELYGYTLEALKFRTVSGVEAFSRKHGVERAVNLNLNLVVEHAVGTLDCAGRDHEVVGLTLQQRDVGHHIVHIKRVDGQGAAVDFEVPRIPVVAQIGFAACGVAVSIQRAVVYVKLLIDHSDALVEGERQFGYRFKRCAAGGGRLRQRKLRDVGIHIVESGLQALLGACGDTLSEQPFGQGDVEIFAGFDSDRAKVAVHILRQNLPVGAVFQQVPLVNFYFCAVLRAFGHFNLRFQHAVAIG